MLITIWNIFFKKVHYLLEKGARFPQTLKPHSKFEDGVLLCILVLESKKYGIPWSMCGKSTHITSLREMRHSFWNNVDFPRGTRHYFGKYPLQNDGTNWLRRVRSFKLNESNSSPKKTDIFILPYWIIGDDCSKLWRWDNNPRFWKLVRWQKSES